MGEKGNEAEWAKFNACMAKTRHCPALFLGIDPGRNGAVGWWIPERDAAGVFSLPRSAVDIAAMLRALKKDSWCKAVVEKHVNAQRYGVPLPRAFEFGRNVGIVQGIIAAVGIPTQELLPVKWQRLAGCQTHGDKKISRAKAQQLFPGVHVTLETADALVLAWVAQQVWRI